MTLSHLWGLTNIATAESTETTGWLGFRHTGGGSPSPGDETDVYVQGNGAKSIKVTSTGSRDEGLWYDVGSGNEIDMTVVGRHLYLWAALLTARATNTRAAGGIYLIVGSSLTNWSKYYVGGSDVTGAGFVRYVLDLNKTPSATGGTGATLTSVRYFGVGVTSSGMTAKSENLICDRIDYGKGEIQPYSTVSTTTGTWQDSYEADNNSANKFGLIDKLENGTFVLRGGVTFGNTSQTVASEFIDETGAVVRFADPQYYNGVALVSAIDAENLYQISAEGALQQTTVTLGTSVGTGDARQGINGGSIGTAGPRFSIDFETNIANLAAVNLYGVSVSGAGETKLSSSTKTDTIGTTFTNSGEVQPNDSEFLNNTIIAPQPDRGLELVSGHNVKQVSMVLGEAGSEDWDRVWVVDVSTTPDTYADYTSEASDPATNDWLFFPPSEGAGDYCAMGYRRKFTRARIDVGTARSGGSIAWEYWNGSTWATLDIIFDNTNDLSTTGLNNVEWFIAPDDWAPLSINGEGPLYYIRIRCVTTFATNPLGTRGYVARQVEHLVNIPAAGTYTFDAIEFFGAGSRSYHVENSVDATLADSYAVTNQDGTQPLGSGVATARGQTFTGNGGVLSHACFMLGSVGTPPTGDVVAKVYAHTGTFGLTGIPTGSALATSEVRDVADLDLQTTLRLIPFEFEDEVTLTNLTKYVVVVEYSAGDGSNYIAVGEDGSAPSHSGNFVSDFVSGGWTASALIDCIFQVHTGGIVTVNATNGSNPSIDQSTGDPQGATIISNPKQYKLDGLVAGTEVRAFRTADRVELAGVESSGTSFTYNHNGDVVPIYVIIQKTDYEWLRINDTLGPADKTVTVFQTPDIVYENA